MGADNVTRFARVDFRSDERVFGIKDEDRFSHVYVIGKAQPLRRGAPEHDNLLPKYQNLGFK